MFSPFCRQVCALSVALLLVTIPSTAQVLYGSLTGVVSDSGGAVDSLRAAPRALTLVAYGDETSPTAGAALAGGLRARGHRVTLVRLATASGPASYDSVRTAIVDLGNNRSY